MDGRPAGSSPASADGHARGTSLRAAGGSRPGLPPDTGQSPLGPVMRRQARDIDLVGQAQDVADGPTALSGADACPRDSVCGGGRVGGPTRSAKPWSARSAAVPPTRSRHRRTVLPPHPTRRDRRRSDARRGSQRPSTTSRRAPRSDKHLRRTDGSRRVSRYNEAAAPVEGRGSSRRESQHAAVNRPRRSFPRDRRGCGRSSRREVRRRSRRPPSPARARRQQRAVRRCRAPGHNAHPGGRAPRARRRAVRGE